MSRKTSFNMSPRDRAGALRWIIQALHVQEPGALGFSVYDLSQVMKVSHQTVRRALDKHGHDWGLAYHEVPHRNFSDGSQVMKKLWYAALDLDIFHATLCRAKYNLYRAQVMPIDAAWAPRSNQDVHEFLRGIKHDG